MKGHFPFFSQLKSSTSPCANGVARACLGCKYANYTSKVNKTLDFQVSSNWKPEGRILNRALAVYCLLNQGTQRAQIVLHKMITYAFMDQNLAVIVFLQNLMWALSKTPLKIYREKTVCQIQDVTNRRG